MRCHRASNWRPIDRAKSLRKKGRRQDKATLTQEGGNGTEDAEGAANAELLRVYVAKRANLVRFFAARLASLAAAEDLVQELYFKIAALDDTVEVHSPDAFLYRIGSNLMLDRLKQERRSNARDGAWRDSNRMTVGGEEVVDEPLPEQALAARARLAKLIEAVGEMPPQMGRAFRLHKLEGLTHAQTAEAMGVSRSAIEKHISAALKLLMRRLG